MLGWILMFALMALGGFFFILAADPASAFISIKIASAVFCALFVLCLITRFVRRRA